MLLMLLLLLLLLLHNTAKTVEHATEIPGGITFLSPCER
jgi:hypothetical protein